MSITSLKKKAPSKQENVLERKRQFKGVRKRKGGKKWVSEVRVPNSRERIWLGSYDTPEEAARAYDYAVCCFRGAKAKLNLPDFSPQNVLAPSCPPEEIQAAAAKYAFEGFRQPSHKDAAFDGNESQSWRLILEEEDPALLDSLLQEFESGESTNVDDLSGQHAPTHDSDFLVLEEQDLLEFQTHPNSLNLIFRLH